MPELDRMITAKEFEAALDAPRNQVLSRFDRGFIRSWFHFD